MLCLGLPDIHATKDRWGKPKEGQSCSVRLGLPLATDKGGTVILKAFPLSKTYQLGEPGPVVLVATARKGRANIMTMSWHMMGLN